MELVYSCTLKQFHLVFLEPHPPIDDVIRCDVIPRFIYFLQQDDNSMLQVYHLVLFIFVDIVCFWYFLPKKWQRWMQLNLLRKKYKSQLGAITGQPCHGFNHTWIFMYLSWVKLNFFSYLRCFQNCPLYSSRLYSRLWQELFDHLIAMMYV